MRAIVAGPDEDGLSDCLRDEGVAVQTIEVPLERPALEDAGVTEADLFVLTDLSVATAIPIVKDLNDAVRIVTYDRADLPDFASRQTDLAIDPDLLDPTAVAEALVD